MPPGLSPTNTFAAPRATGYGQPMKECDLIINCGWLVTVNARDEVLQQHSLVITGNQIDAIVPTATVASEYNATTTLERGSHIVAPGLINTHTHLAMNLLRGYADDMPLMSWLKEKIWPLEQQHVSPEFVASGTRLALAESLRAGVTCVNDMYFFPDQVAEQLGNAGMRGFAGMLVLDFPSAWARDAPEYIQRGLDLHDSLKHNELVKTCFAPHAPYSVSKPHLERIRTLSAELELPVHMHIHETREEVEEFSATHGQRPLAMLDEIGLLGPQLIAVHMTQLNDAEIETVAHNGVHIAHCPVSNMKLASGTAPVTGLHTAGCNIALGTDGAASNNDLDMLGESRHAGLQAKLVEEKANALPAKNLFRMATINGARALGLDEITGSLEPGKAADLICVNTECPEMQPLHDPVSQLVYAASSGAVDDVWINGRQVLQGRELLTIDLQQTLSDARQWAQTLGQ